ncbi:MAG TPA: MTH938/NDUFAF3 family protein [Propionibacteriaceae bacterium]|nr:MTH938/NDUFAF3 family protein [Propionibacteriaceae bacterium]
MIDLEVKEMQAQLLGFGSIEVEGRTYQNDVVIEGGQVRKRRKKPSKPYRGKFGHTPLSADEDLPWGSDRLIIGTGAYGSLPIMPQVVEEARRRGVDLIAVPTEEACQLIADLDPREVHAILHVTC